MVLLICVLLPLISHQLSHILPSNNLRLIFYDFFYCKWSLHRQNLEASICNKKSKFRKFYANFKVHVKKIKSGGLFINAIFPFKYRSIMLFTSKNKIVL